MPIEVTQPTVGDPVEDEVANDNQPVPPAEHEGDEDLEMLEPAEQPAVQQAANDNAPFRPPKRCNQLYQEDIVGRHPSVG